MVSVEVPADLPEKLWRSPFFSTVTTLGSPTLISRDFLGVYSWDHEPVMDSATRCSPSHVISTHVVAPSATLTVTFVSCVAAAAAEAAFLAAASDSACC